MKRSSAVLLTLVIALLLIANSADFFFRQSYYEVWDSAANSLSVIRAKHFEQLYGPYSRWQFHHPGPAAFYVQAFGEWLFFDVLHWTHTPFPAQTLPHVLIMAGFFVAALMIFANWLPVGRTRWWFLCAALACAVPHFTAMVHLPSYDVLLGPTTFMSTWSAHALVLPFLCLLTAGASVAAGRGEDLPVLALAGGYLLQLHVAQPMFVGPVFVLAYLGLLWRVYRVPGTPETLLGPATLRQHAARRLGGAWREFPRAHGLAVVILALFGLPFGLDLCKGSHSNVAAILRHMHEYHSHKSLERAFLYFLQFGAYVPYVSVGNAFGEYDRAGMAGYLHAHAALYALWALVALLAVWALVAGLWSGRGVEVLSVPAATGYAPSLSATRRFRAWAAVFLLLALALTMRWNTSQDGDMFYFNSWFTFAVYYFGALIALAVVCGFLPRSGGVTALRGQPTLPSPERWAGVAVVLVVVALGAGRLRFVDPNPGATLAMHDDVQRLEAASRAGAGGVVDPTRMLVFGYDTAPVAIAVALQLERDHVPFATQTLWQVFIGGPHGWDDIPKSTLQAGAVQTWRFAHRPTLERRAADADMHVTTAPVLMNFLPPQDDISVRYSDPPLDPAAQDGASIRFVAGGNAPTYIIDGWCGPEPWGTWSGDTRGILSFRPVPVPDDGGSVEITLMGLLPLLDPAHGLARQRLRVFFAGEPLGAEAQLTQVVDALVFRVPAAAWNRQAATPAGSQCRLEMEFPDARTPASLNPGGVNQDTRLLGVGIREIRFRVVPPTPAK